MTTAKYPLIHIGDTVRRIQGRPASVGLVGTVTWISDPNVMGAAGDILIKVRLSDGSEMQCYDRQVCVVP